MGEAATFVTEHKRLRAYTDALLREFYPSRSAGEVITAVARCRSELMRAGVRHGLATATEAMARAQLRRAAPGSRRGALTPHHRPDRAEEA